MSGSADSLDDSGHFSRGVVLDDKISIADIDTKLKGGGADKCLEGAVFEFVFRFYPSVF
jgi:hypothetical protein